MEWNEISKTYDKITYHSLEGWCSPVIVVTEENSLTKSTTVLLVCEYMTVYYLNGNVQFYTSHKSPKLNDLLDLDAAMVKRFDVQLPESVFDPYGAEDWYEIERNMDMEVPPDFDEKMNSILEKFLKEKGDGEEI